MNEGLFIQEVNKRSVVLSYVTTEKLKFQTINNSIQIFLNKTSYYLYSNKSKTDVSTKEKRKRYVYE